MLNNSHTNDYLNFEQNSTNSILTYENKNDAVLMNSTQNISSTIITTTKKNYLTISSTINYLKLN